MSDLAKCDHCGHLIAEHSILHRGQGYGICWHRDCDCPGTKDDDAPILERIEQERGK